MGGETVSVTSDTIAAVEARHAANASGVDVTPGVVGLPLKQLGMRHPEHDEPYWRRLNALYEGGKTLLDDHRLLADIFPRHRDELDQIYDERVRRAFYTNYVGEIVDFLTAQLFSKPINVAVATDEDGDGDAKTGETPDFYSDLHEDVSPAGGKKLSLAALLRDQLTTALVKRVAWTLIDLPAMRGYDSLLDQEKDGGLDPFVVAIAPESVLDWEVDDDGELLWAVVWTQDRRRASIKDARAKTTERFVYYTRDGWSIYELTYADDQKPEADTVVPLVDEGAHTFGRVPLIRMEVPSGLWAVSKLEGLAREHFNKRSALAWAETQTLLPELYEFLGPEVTRPAVIIGENQKDPHRATSRRRGQGYVQERGGDDSASFIGPSPEPFKYAAESCKSLRDEMHRVTHLMALTVENNSAALNRSGESKAQDRASTSVVLTALGALVREHAEGVFQLCSLGRGDVELVDQWRAEGMEDFSPIYVRDAVDEALVVDQLTIESATFRKRHRMMLCKAILGETASKEDLAAIEKELDDNITDESFALTPPPPPGMVPPIETDEDDKPADDDEDPEEDDVIAKAAKKGIAQATGRRPMIVASRRK